MAITLFKPFLFSPMLFPFLSPPLHLVSLSPLLFQDGEVEGKPYGAVLLSRLLAAAGKGRSISCKNTAPLVA